MAPAAAPLKTTRPPRPASGVGFPKILAAAEIAAVGDVLPHTPVLTSAKEAAGKHGGFVELFAGVQDVLSSADVAIANLETPVAPRTGKPGQPFVFNAPVELLPALKEAGVDLVTVANNHVYDQGRKGFEETLQVLKGSPLAFVGIGATCKEANEAKVIEAGGVKLAFLGTSQLYNVRLNRKPGEPCAAELDEKVIRERAAAARAAGAEIVILAVHWGGEYQTTPRQEEIDLAHRLLEGGVDAILGHHPHVLQPVEVYLAADGRVTFVAYSLGNFISNQSRFYAFGVHPTKGGNPRDGVILRFRAVRKDYGDGIIQTELADLSVRPVWTENNALDRMRDPKLPVWIRVVIDDRKVDEAAEALRAIDPKQDPKKALALKKQLELFQTRRNAASEILGTDFLWEPNPSATPTVEQPAENP